MDPAFFAIMDFPIKRRDSFLFLKKLFKKWFGVVTYFCFILKGKQNKKEKP